MASAPPLLVPSLLWGGGDGGSLHKVPYHTFAASRSAESHVILLRSVLAASSAAGSQPLKRPHDRRVVDLRPVRMMSCRVKRRGTPRKGWRSTVVVLMHWKLRCWRDQAANKGRPIDVVSAEGRSIRRRHRVRV